MHWELLILFAVGGACAGTASRFVLARLRRGMVLRRGYCELSTALCCAATGALWSLGALPAWWLPVPIAVAVIAVPLCAVDLLYSRLPDALTYPAYAVFAVTIATAALVANDNGLVAGAVIGACVFGGAHLLIHLLVPAALGAGDVKLAGSLGGVLGAMSLAALALAGVLAALVTLLLALVRAAGRSSRWRGGVPHGPGLLAATWLLTLAPGVLH